MSRYVITCKVKDENENNKSDQLMSSHINDEKLLEKYEAIWTKIEGLKNIDDMSMTKDIEKLK